MPSVISLYFPGLNSSRPYMVEKEYFSDWSSISNLKRTNKIESAVKHVGRIKHRRGLERFNVNLGVCSGGYFSP